MFAKVRSLSITSAVLLGLTVISPAQAQIGNTESETLINRVNQLDNQMQTLSRYLYQQNPDLSNLSATAPADHKAAIAVFEQRVSAVETQMRSMTGEIERLQFEMRQLNQKNTLLESRMKALSDQQAKMLVEKTSPVVNQVPVVTPQPSQAIKLNEIKELAATPTQTLSSDTPTAHYDKAFSFVQSKNYEEAEEAFTAFIDQYPTNDLVHNARYWLAETHYVRGDFDKASVVFAEAFKNAPQGNKAADNLLKLGMSLGRISKVKEACVTLTELKKRFPKAPASLLQRANQELDKYSCDE